MAWPPVTHQDVEDEVTRVATDLDAATDAATANTIMQRDANADTNARHVFLTGSTTWANAAARKDYVDAEDEADRAYVRSFAATDLIANGTAYLGDNTNFSNFTFDSADSPVGGGSFVVPVGVSGAIFADELIPIDLSRKYLLRVWARQRTPGAVAYLYTGIAPYDVDKMLIAPQYYQYQANTTTTLAQPLAPGDTEIHLTDASNWYNGSNSTYRAVIVWDYVDGKGKAWPVHTYSRWGRINMYAEGGVNHATGVITLSAPWPDNMGTHAAGTEISNGGSGGTYIYAGWDNNVVPEEWTAKQGVLVGGANTTGSTSHAGNGWPPGTAFARFVVLPNRSTASSGSVHATSEMGFASISFSDVGWVQSEVERATYDATADRLVKRNASGFISGARVYATTAVPTAAHELVRKDYADALGTSSATPSTVVRRNVDGNSYFTEVVVTQQTSAGSAVRKDYADALGTWLATANTIMRREANGKVQAAQVYVTAATPDSSNAAVRKDYADALGTEAATPNTIVRREAGGISAFARVTVENTPVNVWEATRKDYVDAIKAGAEGIVVHDGTAGGGTRPSGYARVRWVGGAARPTNMIAGDVWEHDA